MHPEIIKNDAPITSSINFNRVFIVLFLKVIKEYMVPSSKTATA